MEKKLVRFRVTYLGAKPIATSTIISYFLPIMQITHEKHATIKHAIYLYGSKTGIADYDLEYAVEYDSDYTYWERAIKWWKDKLHLKVEILSMN